MAINPVIREAIVEVLCEQALADNLGDIRDAERTLWKLLGIDPMDFPDEYDSAWEVTQYRLKKHGILPEEYLTEVDTTAISWMREQEIPSHGDKGE